MNVGLGAFYSPGIETLDEGNHVNDFYGHKASSHFGINSNFGINKLISFDLGIAAYIRGSQMPFIDSTNFETGNTGMSVVKCTYLGVPLGLEFNFYSKHRTKYKKSSSAKAGRSQVNPLVVAVYGGLIPAFAIRQEISNSVVATNEEINSYYLHDDQRHFIEALSQFEKLYISGTLGLKITFNPKANFGFYFKPAYTQQFNTIAKSDWASPKFKGYSCDIGVNFTLQ